MIDLQTIKLIDLIPANIRNDPQVAAAAEALDQQLQTVTHAIPGVAIMYNIDNLPDPWVDELAWQWRAPFYDQALPLEQKRELVKKALAWHKRKGTPSAVEELIATVFGSGTVQEWFEYGGEPGYFKVQTSDPSATTDKAKEFLAAVNSVKNTRSWLESIEITTEATMNMYVGIAIHMGDYMKIEQAV
jgi:phage tail P2-like protein